VNLCRRYRLDAACKLLATGTAAATSPSVKYSGAAIRCFASQALLALLATVSMGKDFSMLLVTQLLAKWLDGDRLTQLAERVAGRSRMGVWQRTMHRLSDLGPTEARGYLRARGISIVREETQRLIEQEGAGIARYAHDIEEGAMQLLIDVISARAQSQTTTIRRRAA
jgi:hypothetical protein